MTVLFVLLSHSAVFAQPEDTVSMPGDSSRYLDQQKISFIKADRLQYMPFRSVNGAALSNPNTYYLKYDRLFVDGLEAAGDYVFIEGMQVGDANDFPYRAIGEYHLYRGNQPIQYGNVAGSLVEIKTPVYADKVHFDLDGYTSLDKDYKHNGVELNACGPIRFSGKKKAGRAAGSAPGRPMCQSGQRQLLSRRRTSASISSPTRAAATKDSGSDAMIATGCRVCQQCHRGLCSWGIATQRPDLVARLDPDVASENVANLIHAWTLELSELMGAAGINSIESLRGNRDRLRGYLLDESIMKVLDVKTVGA